MVDAILNAIVGRALPYISAGLLAGCIVLGVTVEIQSSRLTASKANVKRLEAEKVAFAEKILAQNTAVRVWQAEAERQAERARTAQAQAERVRTITVERVREVTAAPVPTDCNQAVRWAASHAVEFNKRWEDGK